MRRVRSGQDQTAPILLNGLHSEHRHCVSSTLATQDELKSQPINNGSNHRKWHRFRVKTRQDFDPEHTGPFAYQVRKRFEYTPNLLHEPWFDLLLTAILQRVRDPVRTGCVAHLPAVHIYCLSYGEVISVAEHFCAKFGTLITPVS